MKIMLMITGMKSGGAERVMATLCNELSRRHQVKLVILKDRETDYTLSENVIVEAGGIQNQNVIQSIAFARKKMEEWNPDIALSFMTKTNIVALCAKLLAKKKIRLVIAERANPYCPSIIYKIIRRFVYPFADGCVFQTKQAQAYYKNILRCRSVVLKNPLNPGFNVKPFEGMRSKRIVTMGRLSEEKNQKLLIEAFAKIADRFPEYRVEIYGDGPLKDQLDAYIKEKHLENSVFLMGRKLNIQEHIADAGVFVLPSNSEGMPNALLEAMALGIPSIATDCPIGGSAVIVKHDENGILIPMNDVDKLAAAMTRMMEDKEFAQKVSKNAANVSVDFSAERVCVQWEEYLTEMAKPVEA